MQLKNGVKLREFGDAKQTWQYVKQGVVEGFQNRFPLEGKNVRLEINNVQVKDRDITKDKQREAKLKDLDLTVPVEGQMRLIDKKSGKVIGQRKMSLGRLPYITPDFGTMIGNGVDFSTATQTRLRPGAYTRVKANDEVETQFNTEGGVGFRVGIEPQSGVFRLNVGSNKLKLYPILKKMGIEDTQMRKAWGKELYDINVAEDKGNFDKFYSKILGKRAVPNMMDREKKELIEEQFRHSKLTPSIMKKHLGTPYQHVTPDAILKSSKKVLGVSRGELEPDDRDSLAVKTFHGVEDFIKEKIEKDAGGIAHRLLFKLDKDKSLDKVPSGYFSPHLKSLMKGDDRVATPEGINPLQFYDLMHKNILLGEGGVGSTDMITSEARAVNPSQIGFVDPIRGPESVKIGIDTWASRNTFKGSDKKIYARYVNAKTGKEEFLSPEEVENFKIALPTEINNKRPTVMFNGKQMRVRRDKVDYYIKQPSELFSNYLNMVPGVSGVQGNRALMAGKAMSDTLPFVEAQAPLVRSEGPDGDFETHYGRKILSRTAEASGEVVSVSDKFVTVKDSTGNRVKHDLYKLYPVSKKTQITHTPVVKVGDKVKEGDVLAKSNYTDDNGTVAVGKHVRAAFIPLRGNTYEDGIVVSESMAKKMTSDHMYSYEVPLDGETIVDKNKFTSYFPALYNRKQVERFDKNGLPKIGTKVTKDDPLILGMKRRALSTEDQVLGNLHKSLKKTFNDVSATWDHSDEGEVVDTVITGKKAKVYVRSKSPLKVGDKLTGRYGNKGVVSEVLPDHEMPLIERTGERLDMALNSMGIISRINPIQIAAGALGKIALEKNKIYRLPNFTDEDYIDMTERELKKHGIPGDETLVDPKTNRKINAFVTAPYFYKLSKTAESQLSSRGIGSYTSNLQPAKGKNDGGKAKRLATMEISALLGHNARYNLRDAQIKGQANPEFWKSYKLGLAPTSPDESFVFEKFKNMLTAAGANVTKTPDYIGIKPLTDKDTTEMSHGEIKNSRLINARNMSPEKGGLFDLGLTGGVTGKKWTHVTLESPMPNPVMEKPIASLLNVKQSDIEKIISGEMTLDGKYGGVAIRDRLAKINVEEELNKQIDLFGKTTKSQKDKVAKKIMYLKGLKSSGVKPEELVINKVPILPPVYRPVSMLEGKGAAIISDPNILYRDMMQANSIYKDLKEDLPEDVLGEDRVSLYKNLKAVSGLGDPVNVKSKKKGIKGFLKKIVGDQPKSGFLFDKVISKTQDLVARAVAVPDSSLGMDELGIPEKAAWDIYSQDIQRNLVRSGVPAVQADRELQEKSPLAFNALKEAMKSKPVLMNRAPTLWKFGIMAFNPKLRKDNTIATSPLIEGPYGLDHDGDALQLHVPVTQEAVNEAREKMMPSKNLFSIKDKSVHYVPTQEDIFGLYLASKEKPKGKTVKFKSIEEMQNAIERGDIDYSTPVEIG